MKTEQLNSATDGNSANYNAGSNYRYTKQELTGPDGRNIPAAYSNAAAYARQCCNNSLSPLQPPAAPPGIPNNAFPGPMPPQPIPKAVQNRPMPPNKIYPKAY